VAAAGRDFVDRNGFLAAPRAPALAYGHCRQQPRRGGLLRLRAADRVLQARHERAEHRGPVRRCRARRGRDRRHLGHDLVLRSLVEPADRRRDRSAAERRTMSTALGEPNATAITFFLLFVTLTLGITYWAARRTKSTEEYFAAGRTISGRQNGFALAGDYMSAASFLGIAGLVSLSGFDGLIYSTGWLVGWPVVLVLIAEPLRNLGKYTFADVVAFRLRQAPVRMAAALGTLSVVA